MNKTFLAILLSMLCCPCYATDKLPPVPGKEKPILAVGRYQLNIEVADDFESRATGLMHRESLPESSGMLFAFPTAGRYCMWMKNTKVPLSVAFMDAHGTIINIADMKPDTEDIHCASRPARYALEVTQNWFQRRGIGPGFKIPSVTAFPARDAED